MLVFGSRGLLVNILVVSFSFQFTLVHLDM